VDGPASRGRIEIVPRLLNVTQAAQYLGVSRWTVRDYILSGLLPAIPLPPLRPREGDRRRMTLRRMLIDRQDLDCFIDRQRAQPAGDHQSRAAEIRPVNTGRNRTAVPELCPKSGGAKQEAP